MRQLLKATRGSSRRASAHAEPRPACPSSPGEEQLALGAILARASLPGAPLLNRRGFDRERKYGPWLVPTFEDRVYNWVWGSGPAWDSTPEVLAVARESPPALRSSWTATKDYTFRCSGTSRAISTK